MKAAKTKSMMGEGHNNKIPHELFIKIEPWSGQPHSMGIECEIQNWSTMKNLHGNFHYKSIKSMPVKEYETFIEKLGSRFSLDTKAKDSMFDELICEENEENVAILLRFYSDSYTFSVRISKENHFKCTHLQNL